MFIVICFTDTRSPFTFNCGKTYIVSRVQCNLVTFDIKKKVNFRILISSDTYRARKVNWSFNPASISHFNYRFSTHTLFERSK